MSKPPTRKGIRRRVRAGRRLRARGGGKSRTERAAALLEIQATIQRYGDAVDSLRFQLFDDTFTADAELDYRSAGGPCGSRDALRDWLATSRAGLLQWQHHLSPPMIELKGERARARTDVYTPNVYRDAQGHVRVLHT